MITSGNRQAAADHVGMKRNRAEHFSTSLAEGPASQYAALCWRMHRGKIQVLLITSRDTGRWIIPKGWPMTNKTPAESAAQEAWEEAGVTGELDAGSLGYYGYDKLRDTDPPLPCMVSVFSVRVTGLASKYPERKQRRRKWFDTQKAVRKVAEPELKALLQHLTLVEDRLVHLKSAAEGA